MSLSELVAAARRQKSPRELERFLDEACGSDIALRQEILRQIGVTGGDSSAIPGTQVYLPNQETGQSAAEPASQPQTGTAEIDVRIGDVLAEKYKIREEIGRGGMGAVFAADQITPVERRVAIKVLKAGMDSAHIVARFAQERQALALMDHANIARIYDGDLTRLGRPFFAMELVRGLPFARFCDQEKLNIRQRIELFIPVCQAVQHAHQKGIIHRDLKPSNILVALHEGKPAPKIIDFGLAKAIHGGLTEHSVYTAQNTMVGTLEYMAPEQASLTGLDIDTRADIYSLGVVLYELLCGNLPLSRHEELRGSLDEVVRKIREIEPPRPSTRVSTLEYADAVAAQRHLDRSHLLKAIRGDLDWVVMKCLEKERDRRYATAQELGADLQRYLNEEPVQAAPPSRVYRIKKFCRRHSGMIASASAMLLLLIVGAIVATVGWVRAARAERLARDESAIHQALAGFIQHDMFDAIDPSERAKLNLPLDSHVELQTLLDRVSDQIKAGRLADQPRVEAAMRLTLAKAYSFLGKTTQAMEHARRADDLRLAIFGPAHVERLESLEMLGQVQFDADKPAEATETLKQALQLRQASLGANDPKSLKTRYTLAYLERRQGNIAEAEKQLRELLGDQRRVLGNEAEDTLTTQRGLGETLIVLRKFEEAESQLRDVLKIWENKADPNNPNALGALNNLANAYRRQRDYAKAEEVYRDLLKRAAKVYAADHPIVAVYKTNLAVCLNDQKKYAESLQLLRQARPVLEHVDPKHYLTLVTKSNLASVLARVNEFDESNALYDALLPQYVDVFGSDKEVTWNFLREMANNQAIQRNHRRAVELWSQLLGYQKAKNPIDREKIGETTYALSLQLIDSNEFAQAEKVVQEVLKELPPDSAARRKLQSVLEQLGKKP